MFVVIAYDISDDRRRLRLYKALKRFGTPVQKSVVECWVTAKELRRMKEAIGKIIEEESDQVRYYYLCEACQPRMEATRSSRITSDTYVMIA